MKIVAQKAGHAVEEKKAKAEHSMGQANQKAQHQADEEYHKTH